MRYCSRMWSVGQAHRKVSLIVCNVSADTNYWLSILAFNKFGRGDQRDLQLTLTVSTNSPASPASLWPSGSLRDSVWHHESVPGPFRSFRLARVLPERHIDFPNCVHVSVLPLQKTSAKPCKSGRVWMCRERASNLIDPFSDILFLHYMSRRSPVMRYLPELEMGP